MLSREFDVYEKKFPESLDYSDKKTSNAHIIASTSILSKHLGEVERDLRCRVNLEKTVIEQRAASLQRQALKLARQRAFLREERKRARKEEKKIAEDKDKLEHVKKVSYRAALPNRGTSYSLTRHSSQRDVELATRPRPRLRASPPLRSALLPL